MRSFLLFILITSDLDLHRSAKLDLRSSWKFSGSDFVDVLHSAEKDSSSFTISAHTLFCACHDCMHLYCVETGACGCLERLQPQLTPEI